MKDRKTLILLALAVFANLLKICPSVGKMAIDFRSFYFAGRGFFGGGNIYDFKYLDEWAARSALSAPLFPYLYPPPLAFYMIPLSQLGEKTAATVWVLLSLVLAALIMAESVYLSLSLYNQGALEKKHVLPLLSLLLFLILPFDDNLNQGQVNIVVLSFIGAAMVQSRVYNRDFLAGLLLAPATLVKLTPVGLLLFFVINQRYRTLYGFVLGMVVFAAPTFVVSGGLETWKSFLDFSATAGYGKTVPGLFPAASLPNFSIAGCVARFTSNEATIGLVTLVVLSALGLGLLIQHYRLQRKGIGELLLLPYLVLMIIGSPLTYVHHVIYVFPGLLLTSWIILIRGRRSRSLLLACVVGFALLASVNFPIMYEPLGMDTAILRSLNLYALFCLFILGLIVPELCGVTKENLSKNKPDNTIDTGEEWRLSHAIPRAP